MAEVFLFCVSLRPLQYRISIVICQGVIHVSYSLTETFTRCKRVEEHNIVLQQGRQTAKGGINPALGINVRGEKCCPLRDHINVVQITTNRRIAVVHWSLLSMAYCNKFVKSQ